MAFFVLVQVFFSSLILRYESSNLILYIELSSSIFLSTKSQLIERGYQIKLKIYQNILYSLCYISKDACTGTAGALVFTILMIEQHNTFSFWNRLPNQFRELSKYLVFSMFMSQNACFSFPNFGTAHHFQRIMDD